MSLADLLGVGKTTGYEHKGRSYKFRCLTIEEMAKLSTWLEERAFLTIDRQTYLKDEVLDRMRTNLVHEIAAGVYEPGGTAFAAASMTVAGQAYSLWLAMTAEDDAVTLEDCEEVIRTLYEEAASDANVEIARQAKAAWEDGDPKKSSAGQEGSSTGAT